MSYVNNVTDTIFADVSEFQTPVTNAYTDAGYRVLSIRSNDGTHRDRNFTANYNWCVQACNEGRLDFFIVYFYWRVGPGDVDTHITMVQDLGGPHPKMVTMIDLESGGNANVNSSGELNAEYNRLTNWLASPKRVIGYANVSDERSMWQAKPGDLQWILAGYGSNPQDSSLHKLAHQYTDGQGYGGGLPEGAPPWARCDMNSADGLSSRAFATICGVGEPPHPPPPPPVSWNLPTDDSIYGLADELVGQFMGAQ